MIRALKRWQTALLVMVAALTVILSNCTNNSQPIASNNSSANNPTARSAEQATLVFGLVGDPATLESGNVTDGYSHSHPPQPHKLP